MQRNPQHAADSGQLTLGTVSHEKLNARRYI